ncbi:hypothetical protein [Candidatus Odyssella acanthamoebae]|uniref:Uncharacterized protein n=1 Tax=Candidatus Odyssella acanthamoebae TaxID=91604 RepID=A0A077B2B3_9PROT|nr:hypothetical protein [Candidatus Paracaedibacter acanthamoebae]AIK97125.1 hypothetical protein ID47_10905 [Candidatus Paracaedibacter acanthamoebae]
MERIVLLSQYITLITRFFMVVIPAGFIGVWGFMQLPFINNLIKANMILNPISTPEGLINLADVQWTFLSKTVAMSAGVIGSLPIYKLVFCE